MHILFELKPGFMLQAMAECSGNLVSDNLMSSPVAETALKTTALKVIMVCVSTCLDEFPGPQAVLMFICPCLSAYLQIRSVSMLLAAACLFCVPAVPCWLPLKPFDRSRSVS